MESTNTVSEALSFPGTVTYPKDIDTWKKFQTSHADKLESYYDLGKNIISKVPKNEENEEIEIPNPSGLILELNDVKLEITKFDLMKATETCGEKIKYISNLVKSYPTHLHSFYNINEDSVKETLLAKLEKLEIENVAEITSESIDKTNSDLLLKTDNKILLNKFNQLETPRDIENYFFNYEGTSVLSNLSNKIKPDLDDLDKLSINNGIIEELKYPNNDSSERELKESPEVDNKSSLKESETRTKKTQNNDSDIVNDKTNKYTCISNCTTENDEDILEEPKIVIGDNSYNCEDNTFKEKSVGFLGSNRNINQLYQLQGNVKSLFPIFEHTIAITSDLGEIKLINTEKPSEVQIFRFFVLPCNINYVGLAGNNIMLVEFEVMSNKFFFVFHTITLRSSVLYSLAPTCKIGYLNVLECTTSEGNTYPFRIFGKDESKSVSISKINFTGIDSSKSTEWLDQYKKELKIKSKTLQTLNQLYTPNTHQALRAQFIRRHLYLIGGKKEISYTSTFSNGTLYYHCLYPSGVISTFKYKAYNVIKTNENIHGLTWDFSIIEGLGDSLTMKNFLFPAGVTPSIGSNVEELSTGTEPQVQGSVSSILLYQNYRLLAIIDPVTFRIISAFAPNLEIDSIELISKKYCKIQYSSNIKCSEIQRKDENKCYCSLFTTMKNMIQLQKNIILGSEKFLQKIRLPKKVVISPVKATPTEFNLTSSASKDMRNTFQNILDNIYNDKFDNEFHTINKDSYDLKESLPNLNDNSGSYFGINGPWNNISKHRGPYLEYKLDTELNKIVGFKDHIMIWEVPLLGINHTIIRSKYHNKSKYLINKSIENNISTNTILAVLSSTEEGVQIVIIDSLTGSVLYNLENPHIKFSTSAVIVDNRLIVLTEDSVNHEQLLWHLEMKSEKPVPSIINLILMNVSGQTMEGPTVLSRKVYEESYFLLPRHTIKMIEEKPDSKFLITTYDGNRLHITSSQIRRIITSNVKPLSYFSKQEVEKTTADIHILRADVFDINDKNGSLSSGYVDSYLELSSFKDFTHLPNHFDIDNLKYSMLIMVLLLTVNVVLLKRKKIKSYWN